MPQGEFIQGIIKPCLYLPGDNLLIFLFSFIILNRVRDCYGQLTPERSSASSQLC